MTASRLLAVSCISLLLVCAWQEVTVVSTPKYIYDLSDTDLLALCIWTEARGESEQGQIAVGNVVMNRVKLGGWYGKTIREVVLKPYQFSWFNNPPATLTAFKKMYPSSVRTGLIPHSLVEVAVAVIDGKTDDPTGGATHYHAASMKVYPGWTSAMTQTVQIGGHIFYK